jgi:putative nucleotidyltransferase with HDIG domain
MKTKRTIDRDEVVAKRDALPAFPRVINDLLSSLDDPDVNLNTLVEQITHDPIIAARVFAEANSAAERTQTGMHIRDIYTATSMIGLSRLREKVLMSSISRYLHAVLPGDMTPGFWQHSAATGISAQQVAMHCNEQADAALVAGLLHDIGQLWLCQIYPDAWRVAWTQAVNGAMTIDQAERETFGVDHAVIGAWLGAGWGLPPELCRAIQFHHEPDQAMPDRLVAITHIAEVLSNALNTAEGQGARVTRLSSQACDLLKLNWDESVEPLFGRIDAISLYVSGYYKD